MGCCPSFHYKYSRQKFISAEEANILNLILPIYYKNKHTILSTNDILDVKNCWGLITVSSVPIQNDKNISNIMHFYNTFYGRMYDINFGCKQLFTGGLKIEIKFLISMMNIILRFFFN